MATEKRIIDAFRANDITKVLLIDDAYDAPDLADINQGVLQQYLDSEEGVASCLEIGLMEQQVEAAAVALQEGELEDEALDQVFRSLYEKYSQTRVAKFDPGGEFDLRKGPALNALTALQALLGKCMSADGVHVAGLNGGEDAYDAVRPQVIFLDYYLDDDVPAAGDAGEYEKRRGRRASLNLLGRIVGTTPMGEIPAVILMSSRDIREHNVDQYRKTVEHNPLIAVRFRFLKKGEVRKEDGGLVIGHAAADALLDTSQGFLFGKAVQEALDQWRTGAENAITTFLKEVGDLQMKDFAYLLRFRLREEGQSLSEYLEWFFGECLTAIISEEVNWGHASFRSLDGEHRLEKDVEGAFEGPTLQIATFFHRARFGGRIVERDGIYQMGDLYGRPEDGEVRAVITPDCDLVVRKGKTKAANVLTMGAEVQKFGKNGVSADNFILVDNVPYSLRWRPKDLALFPIATNEAEGPAYGAGELLATLRPLYAQEMQRQALTDLSRIGVPVAPAMGINARVTVWMRKNGEFQNLGIGSEKSRLATVIPPRAGEAGEGYYVLLRRRFVNELIEYLGTVSNADFDEEDREDLVRVQGTEGAEGLYRALVSSGGRTRRPAKSGVGFVLGEGPNRKKGGPWLQIVVNLSEEEMSELRISDPLLEVPLAE